MRSGERANPYTIFENNFYKKKRLVGLIFVTYIFSSSAIIL